MIQKTKTYLEKEYSKLKINLDKAERKPGVSELEILALKDKIEINLFLQQILSDGKCAKCDCIYMEKCDRLQ